MRAYDPLMNLNTTKIMVLAKKNCSTYDLCGPYGYCDDHSDGELTCVCKFWWKGALCDTLSSVGKQVIALGIVTALLVALYYNLTLLRWLKKKRRKPAKSTIIAIDGTVHRTSRAHRKTITNSSDRLLSWLTGIISLILGTLALVIKGVILKNIHNEIIYKYEHNQSLFYNRPSICGIIYMREEFNMFTFPLSCLLIFLFIVMTKRKSSGRDNCCHGYFAIPIPLDFFAHIKRTFAALTFAIVANELANIANQFINGNASGMGDGVVVTYIVQIMRVLVIGFHCYPMLAAVYLNTRFALVCATLYSWFDFSMNIAFNGVCRNDYYSTNDNYNQTEGIGAIFFLEYYGTGSTLVFIQLLTDIPRCFFLAYICVELPVLLFKRIRDRKISAKELTREEENLLYSSLPNSIESQYVENLLGLKENTVAGNRIIRLFRRIYTWRDDFRFSSRVICAYTSIFFLLFFLTVQAYVQVIPILSELSDSHRKLTIASMNTRDTHSTQTDNALFDFSLPNLVQPYIFAISTAFIVTAIQLLVLLASIRRNLLQVFRGDNSEVPRRNAKQNVNYACENIHFAGYLIGYVLWGYLIVAVFAMIIGLAIDVVITYGMVRFAEYVLKLIIPPTLFAIFQYYMNKILGQFVFLQEAGEVLSINHRRILMLFLYFNFFLDAFLGFMSSIARVLKSAIGGIIYMCRLDYSSLGRKLESYEAGFSAYCGFIHMECAHRHPVLLYFASLLIREHLCGTKEARCSRVRRRWHLAIFLVRNPTLIYRRKRFAVQSQTNDTKIMLIGRRHMKTICPEESLSTSHVQSTNA